MHFLHSRRRLSTKKKRKNANYFFIRHSDTICVHAKNYNRRENIHFNLNFRVEIKSKKKKHYKCHWNVELLYVYAIVLRNLLHTY